MLSHLKADGEVKAALWPLIWAPQRLNKINRCKAIGGDLEEAAVDVVAIETRNLVRSMRLKSSEPSTNAASEIHHRTRMQQVADDPTDLIRRQAGPSGVPRKEVICVAHPSNLPARGTRNA